MPEREGGPALTEGGQQAVVGDAPEREEYRAACAAIVPVRNCRQVRDFVADRLVLRRYAADRIDDQDAIKRQARRRARAS